MPRHTHPKGSKQQRKRAVPKVRRYRLLLAAAGHAEAVMSIVEPRSDKKEYLETLGELRAAIAAAT